VCAADLCAFCGWISLKVRAHKEKLGQIFRRAQIPPMPKQSVQIKGFAIPHQASVPVLKGLQEMLANDLAAPH
jgi:hypothetical protein